MDLLLLIAGLLAGAGDVVRAMEHGLHPAEAGIAGGRDLLLGERHER